MSGYVIATESRKRDELLFMVDRRRERRSFWSNCLESVFVYRSYEAACEKARSLKFNAPQVMSYADARDYCREAERERAHEAAMDAAEMGWDAHKSMW